MKNKLVTSGVFAFMMAALVLSGCDSAASQPQPTVIPPVTNNGIVTAEGRIVPRDSAVLAFAVSGELQAVSVREGAQVKAGTLLVSLKNREQAHAAIAAARLEQVSAQQGVDKLTRLADLARDQALQQLFTAEKALIVAQKAYDDLDTDTFRQDLDDKEIAVQDAKTAVDDAQTELDKYKDLEADNQTRKNAEQALEDAQKILQKAVYERDLLKNSLDQADAILKFAKTTVAEARRAYEARLNGPDMEEWALAQARLENANRQAAAAERVLVNYDLKAPYDGRVMEIKNLLAGEWVALGQPAIVFADVSSWYVETKDMNELDVVNLELGQPATIVPDAMKDLTLNGKVDWIGETYSEKSGDVLYTVRIKLEEMDSRLRWGMTVQVRFE
jgi:multidrug resistance efflux pump